jgi:hypothetical protein
MSILFPATIHRRRPSSGARGGEEVALFVSGFQPAAVLHDLHDHTHFAGKLQYPKELFLSDREDVKCTRVK